MGTGIQEVSGGFPYRIVRGDMVLRIKEWKLLGYDVVRLAATVVVGHRKSPKRESLLMTRVRWLPDWDVSKIYMLKGSSDWVSVNLSEAYLYGILVAIERKGPESWRFE